MTPEPNPSQGTFVVAAYKGCSFCGTRWTDARWCPTCQDARRCTGCGKVVPQAAETGDFGFLCDACEGEINSQNQGA